MKTIAIVFALTVLAGAAPAAAHSLDHLAEALLLFTAALTALLLACLAAGWRMFELRTAASVVSARAAAARAPRSRSALRPARSPSLDGLGATDGMARVPGFRPWYGGSLEASSHPGHVAVEELALTAQQPEQPALVSSSIAASSSRLAGTGAGRSESLRVPS